jgi:hypothetical protein
MLEHPTCFSTAVSSITSLFVKTKSTDVRLVVVHISELPELHTYVCVCELYGFL